MRRRHIRSHEVISNTTGVQKHGMDLINCCVFTLC